MKPMIRTRPRPSLFGKPSAGALAVAALLLVHYGLALSALRLKSPTFDETAHITAGYSFWRLNDYRLQPENGNLPQRLAALPLVLSESFVFPGLAQTAWQESDVWTIGDQFFHAVGNDLEAILWRSRAGMALLGAALCLVVFLWARCLHGTAGGLVALVLCTFSPMILANGPLATSDTCAALFFLLGIWSLWLVFQRITLPRLLTCAAALSGLALSKTSAVLIVPMAALMLPAALLLNRGLHLSLPGKPPQTIHAAPRRLAAMIGAILLCALIAWGAIWVAFGCRYAPVPARGQGSFQHYLFPGAPLFTLADVAAAAGTPGKAIGLLGRLRLLPEAFLYGTAYVLASVHHYGFLNGELSVEGWRRFFPYCFLVKSTLPMLMLVATALLLPAARWLFYYFRKSSRGATIFTQLSQTVSMKMQIQHPFPSTSLHSLAGEAPALGISGEKLLAPARRPGLCGTAPLWILLAVYWPMLIFSSINIGARHMLPVYPAIFILLGGLARRMSTAGVACWVLPLLLWHAGEGLRGYPHYLAYFNQITGRQQAYRHLVDSSLDWGQDLPGLKAWLDLRRSREPQLRAYLSYFGTGKPEHYGIVAEPLELEERSERGLPPAGGAGAYCVSATNLQAVYYPVRGRWNSRYEAAYQELLRNAADPGRIDARKLHWLQGRAGESDPASKLDMLGSARLLAYLRGREPDAAIGYSILCYELSQADIGQALHGPPPEMALPGPSGI